MAKSRKPSSARLITGVLYFDKKLFEECLKDIEEKFGSVCFKTEAKSFTHTRYYESEMGKDLKRIFLVFEKLWPRDKLAEIKIETNELEDKYSKDPLPAGNKSTASRARCVNLDPGFMTLENFVLASCKGFAHRIYLSDGVYGDLTLVYRKDTYTSLEWTYPDYCENDTISFLNEQRRIYKKELEGQGKK